MNKKECEKQFNNIVKDYNKSEYFSDKLCPDQYICTIENVKNDYFDTAKRKNIFDQETLGVYKDNIPDAENIFVTILESSHISEHFEQLSKYKHGEMRENPSPAIGKYSGDTGSNIVKYIAEIFPNLSNYHLILMNAIPFQCSLGAATQHFRYDVFQNAWADKHIGAEFCKKRLTDFLNALSSKNIVIVNACTKGYNAAKDSDQRPFLWHLVQNSIETLTLDEEKTIRYFRINHPSSWARNKKNREIKDHRQITFPKTKK